MQKASRILLLVATIVSTVVGALLLACVPALFVLGVSPTIANMLRDAINSGEIKNDPNVPVDTAILILQIVFIVTAVVLLTIGVCAVINAIISSKTRKNPTRGLYIACIVTGALSTDFSIVAGILGLITLSKQERNKQIVE